MKTIAEIADEYERNLVLLRQRRDELKAQAKAEPCAELKITIRPRSCKLTTATRFLYQGHRYDVQYWQPHYKRRDRIEVMVRLVVEDGA